MGADERPRSGAAPVRKPRARPKRRRGKGAIGFFLVVNAIPIAAAVFFFLQPPPMREQMVAAIPEGAGGRAIKAAICFGVMIALAFLALPAFHGASNALQSARARWFEGRHVALRVLLFPVELVLWLVWFVFQILFAVDAVLILASGLLGLVLSVRVFSPAFLEGVLPEALA